MKNKKEKMDCHDTLRVSRNDEKRVAFTHLVNPLRSGLDSPVSHSAQSGSQSSQTKFRNCVAHSYGFTLTNNRHCEERSDVAIQTNQDELFIKKTGLPRPHFVRPRSDRSGFTLAETLITLTILGIIAAITIPALINKQLDNANKTKVKKSMEAYEKALNQMVIENDIKGNISSAEGFRTSDNCSGTTNYFKKIDQISNCRFKTSDKVWWDITNIENPIIILKDELKNEELSALQTKAKDISDKTV